MAMAGRLTSSSSEANQAFGRMTGLEPVVGKRVTELWPGIEEDSTFELFARVALTGEPARFEHFVAPLGRYFEFSAFCPRKGRVGVISIDISDRKMAEARAAEHAMELQKKAEQLVLALSVAEEASRVNREFLNNMSHEMRTPMNGVLGMLGLLLETPLSDEQRNYAMTAQTSAAALKKREPFALGAALEPRHEAADDRRHFKGGVFDRSLPA